MNGTELLINLLVSSIGAGYFIYGRKQNKWTFMIDGLVMTIYPYFVTSVTWTLIIGLVLIIFPFVARRYI